MSDGKVVYPTVYNINTYGVASTASLHCKPLRSNVVTPEIIVGPTWLRDDKPAVEIIELNSSNEEISPRESNRDGRRHAWSYVNNEEMQQIENSYKINRLARERRRLQNANETIFRPREINNWDNIETKENNCYINNSKTCTDDKAQYNRNIDRLSSNNLLVNSDTSTDTEYGDIEVITSADIIVSGDNNWGQYDNNLYNEEIITYDADLDQETRTIWIYSFKNKNLLSDDFEEAPSNKSSDTSYSTDSSGNHNKDTSHRIGSPTPPTYIPRLDLSLVPTLSTVMEISERNLEATPDKSLKSVKSTSRNIKKRSDNWCGTKNDVRSIRKHDKSTSIINWMSLSPRERRRVLKDKSVSDTWIGPYLNLTENCTIDDKGDERQVSSRSGLNDIVKVKVDVEVHVDQQANGDTTKREPNSANKVVKVNVDDIKSISKIKYADAANEECQNDRGDTVKHVAPAICLTSRRRKSDITKPIENLENPDWIYDSEEKETNVYDYVLEKSESLLDVSNKTNVVDHLWMKNTVPFLKPSDWTEFRPIADSPISYHLSIGSIEERKTWFKRFINFLKCCK